MTAKNTYGYIRVSTLDQYEDRQLIALEPYAIPKGHLYIDKQSGKDFKRPAYRQMIRRLRPGDLLIIKSIDRLGRNYAEVIEQWRVITRDKGADIKVLDMPLLDTTYCRDLLGTFISDLVLQVLSFSAHLERENILQRQAEGISAAKKRGVKFGREPVPLPDDFDVLYRKWRGGEMTGTALAELCGFSRETLYQKTKKYREKEAKGR